MRWAAGAAAQMVKKQFDAHSSDYVSNAEIHGMRVNQDSGALEYYDGTAWKVASGGFKVGNISNFDTSISDQTVTLTWQDPVDTTIETSNGNTITIAKWAGTVIRRKTGSYPVDETDGELVVDSTTRNQYESTGYNDTGLTNGTEYYYMAFPYTENGLHTVDSSNRVTATPTENDDTSGSPGSAQLQDGNSEAGWYGTVLSSDFITGDQLASEVGLTAGTSQFSNTDWLKFSSEGNPIFSPQKPIRYDLSWDNLNNAGVVFGNKTVTIDGLEYAVRLWRGAQNDPFNYNDNDRDAIGSEWNNLMLPIHEHAATGNWAYPNYVDTPTEDWGIGFTDEDLVTDSDFGDGSYTWCQETRSDDSAYRSFRGDTGVSYANSSTSSTTFSDRGWRPVLELL